MSLLQKTMNQWLKNAKAAELLGVGVRTIKRWMTRKSTREALLAVRHGKQWRIPRPENEDFWDTQTRLRLKELGIDLPTSWERELDKLGKRNNRYLLESYRLWLAAYSQVTVKSEGVTQEDVTAIVFLWQTACNILVSLPKGTAVDKLKSQFPESLRAHNFSEGRIPFIMSYWPEQKNFKRVRNARTLEQLEKIRSGMDTTQAVKTCKNLGQIATGDNLRPLLHKDFVTHINDTREQLRPDVVDLRQPQKGLTLRTFRNHHPPKNSPLKKIIATVYDFQVRGADEKPHGG